MLRDIATDIDSNRRAIPLQRERQGKIRPFEGSDPEKGPAEGGEVLSLPDYRITGICVIDPC
jgi:hypothetical protein